MISGGGSDSKSTTKPWEGQEDYLRNLYSRAESLHGGGGYDFYPGSRVSGFDPASNRAFGMVENRATQGSSLNRAAQGHAEDTLGGKYLDVDSNPYLQRTGEAGARNLRRQYYGAVNSLGSRMEGAGRTMGGAQAVGQSVAQENFATGLGDMYASLYGKAYGDERNRMMGAAGQAPQLSELDYRDADAMRNVGLQREGKSQDFLNDLIERFNWNQRGGEKERIGDFQGFLGSPVMQQDAKASSFNFGVL